MLINCHPEDGVGRDSVVGIATRCGLDGPGIESRWERDFPLPSRRTLGPTRPPVQWVPGAFPREKLAGRGVDHPPYLVPRLKKEKTPCLDLRGLFDCELYIFFLPEDGKGVR